MEIVERMDNVLVFYLVCLVKRIDKKSITKKKKKNYFALMALVI